MWQAFLVLSSYNDAVCIRIFAEAGEWFRKFLPFLSSAWQHEGGCLLFSPTSGISLMHAKKVAQEGEGATRIHRQKEKRIPFWDEPLPDPERLSLLSVSEQAPRGL